MTNAMIIFWQSVDLMNAGVIGSTGRKLTMALPDGTEREIMEPEPIHTFACWKAHGFSVKKGEKAIARFPIWKGAEKAIKDDDGNDTDEKALKMFRKESCFFSASQVERTEDRPRKERKAPVPAPAPDKGYGSWLN